MHNTAAKPVGGMEAAPDDPLVGVYVLSQFVYCPRAGIIAYENREEQEEKPDSVNLDYVPLYEVDKLQELLDGNLKVLVWQALGLAAIFAVTYYLMNRVHPDLAFLGFGATLLLLFGPVRKTLCHIVELYQCVFAHRRAVAREPDLTGREFPMVRWCEMLKAGFISVSFDRIRNDEWKLEGRPWRVLRRGNLSIPVFFQTATDTQVHPKHLAKAAAYCFLLQTVGLAESPYALVLKEGSFEGTLVPYNPRSRMVFHNGLRRAREMLRAQKAGLSPSPPERDSFCRTCPHGQAKLFQPGFSEHRAKGFPLPIVVISDDGKVLYHSHCGDRFDWVPPHEKTRERNMHRV